MANSKEKKYRAPDGTMYDSYEDYVNAPDLDTDIIQSMLWTGERKPQNDFERSLLRTIKEAQRQGKYLEYYPE